MSRKAHGTAGVFDVNLPLTGAVGIECRSGGSTMEYQLAPTFAEPITFDTAAVNGGNGTVTSAVITGAAEGQSGPTAHVEPFGRH